MATIFGFNTDAKVGDTVYHVQSEAREKELLLETQVFVAGRCIGKRASSYADRYADPAFTPQAMHELLKAQHREVLEAVRGGNVQKALRLPLAGGLVVEWLNADSLFSPVGSAAVLVRVTDGDAPISGARVIARFDSGGDPQYTHATTGADGCASFTFPPELLAAPAGSTLSVVLQASSTGRIATRRYRLRRA